jgi:hypothetical protein
MANLSGDRLPSGSLCPGDLAAFACVRRARLLPAGLGFVLGASGDGLKRGVDLAADSDGGQMSIPCLAVGQLRNFRIRSPKVELFKELSSSDDSFGRRDLRTPPARYSGVVR